MLSNGRFVTGYAQAPEGRVDVLEIITEYREGSISAEEAIDKIEYLLKHRPQLEQLAIELGFLSMKQLRRLLHLQESSPLSFERLAIREGYLTEQQIGLLMFEQNNRMVGMHRYSQSPSAPAPIANVGFTSNLKSSATT